MAHLFAVLVIETLGEVDGVVQEGGLRCGRGYDWDLVASDDGPGYEDEHVLLR